MKKILFALSWGTQYPKPGLSNEALAHEVIKIKNDFDYTLVQIEIGEVLTSRGSSFDHSVGEPGVYINTYHVFKEMIAWLEQKGIDASQHDIWILCHQTHWTGCKLVLKKFNIVPKRVSAHIPYDPQSQHWYTRSFLHSFIGKVVRGFLYVIRGEI